MISKILIFFIPILLSFAAPRILTDISYYTNCTFGTVIINYQSRYYFEIANQTFTGNSCEAFQNNYNYHTWCVTPNGYIWSTVLQKFLGLAANSGNSYGLYTLDTLDLASQQWTFTLQSTNFQTITQTRNGITYAIKQIPTDNGAGLPHAIPVGVGIYNSSDLKQHWWLSQIGRKNAQPSYNCTAAVQSAQFPGVFLSSQPCLILLQYGIYDSELWILHSPGLSSTSGKQLFCVMSQKWGHYLSLNGAGCTMNTASGCGSVTTSPTCGSDENFVIISNNNTSNAGTLGLISDAFPTVDLRLDGTGITAYQGPGGGFVNGQVVLNFNIGTVGNERVFIAGGTANSVPVGINPVQVRGYITNGDTNTVLSVNSLTNFPINITFWGNGLIVSATIFPATGIYQVMLPLGIYQRMAVIQSNINEITLSVLVNVSFASNETNSGNTVLVYAQNTTAIPIKGCVWLQTCVFSMFQICNNIPDFRAIYLDKKIIALIVGLNTIVTLFNNYAYTGNSQIIMTSGITTLTNFSGQASSASVVYTFTVRGYIQNGETNNLISSDILTSQNPAVTFTGNGNLYVATIIPANGTYSIVLCPGIYLRNATINLYMPANTTINYALDSDSNETNYNNTILIVMINITIQGYINNSDTNNSMPYQMLSSQNPVVTFIGSSQTYVATIIPASGMYSVSLHPGTYVRCATMNLFVPGNVTLNYTSNSDQTNNNNTVLFVPITITIQGYINNSDTNNSIPSQMLSSQNPVVTFIGSYQTYVATINPASGMYSVLLHPGTYVRSATMNLFVPGNVTLNYTSNSDQTNNNNTVLFVPITIIIQGYINYSAINYSIPLMLSSQNPIVSFIGSSQTYAATIIPGSGMYSVSLHPGTYVRNATLNFFWPSTITMNYTSNSDQTNNNNTIVFVLITVTIRGYLQDGLTNNLISSQILTSNNAAITFINTNQSYPTTINPETGIYSVVFPPGTYVRSARMNQYLLTIVNISFTSDSNETNNCNTVFFVQNTITIRGYLMNGQTLSLISFQMLTNQNVAVTFTGNGNLYFATIIPANATYSVVLPPGTYVRSATIDQFVPTTTTLIYAMDSNETNNDNTVLLVLIFQGWRAVLTWNVNIDSELDSWVLFPNDFVTYYKTQSPDGVVHIDNPDGPVPETTSFTFSSTTQGVYSYYVQSYNHIALLTQSQVKVAVYQGSTQVSEIIVASSSNITNYWHAFSIIVNGTVQIYQEINAFEQSMS